MTKATKRTLILTTFVCLIPLIAGAVMYPQLPDRIITHWDAAGNPNGWSSKAVGVFVLPGSLLLLNLLFPFLLKIDPKYENISEKIRCLIQWTIPVIDIFAAGITLTAAAGVDMKVSLLAPLFMGVLFIALGNFMPKMAQSYTVGIRVPWTLDDEEIWDRTHRFAGFLWVICGVLMMACAFLPWRMTAFMLLLVLMVLAPILYSYILFLQKKKS